MLLMAAATAHGRDDGSIETASPNGELRVTLSVRGGVPCFEASLGDSRLIEPSRFGFLFRKARPLNGGFEVADVRRRSVDETWRPVWGQAERVLDRFNEVLVLLVQPETGGELEVAARVYDDGFGLRMTASPAGSGGVLELTSELTEFRFAEDALAWWIPADYDSYEHLYRTTPLAEVPAANTPLTMRRKDGVHLAVHEANLRDYAGMTLEPLAGAERAFRCELVPWPDGVKVVGEAPIMTPWRAVIVARRAGDLAESRLIENLNEPCVLEDTSWIRPMKYVGIWWGLHIGRETWHEGPRHGATTANTKRLIDFASDHGFDAVLVEGWNTGWDRWGKEGAYDQVTPYGDFDIEEVVRYAGERGVSLIGHHETGGDARGYERIIDEAFALYERLGVRAVKTGYAGAIFPRGQHHHGQWMVQHYQMVVEKAARHRISLDVHEPIKPTGLSRTWPNLMTGEGGRGQEYNAWSEGNPPEHTTILPFTRLLAGPFDYTPGIVDVLFDGPDGGHRVRSTVAKELALSVVLYSPLQMAADLPENYEGHPGLAFLSAVPVDWDETRFLQAGIGDFVVVARRSGRDWFLGAVTDESARSLRVPLDFLERGEYRATIFADGEGAHWESSPAPLDVQGRVVTPEQSLTLELAAGGGAAIQFERLGEGASGGRR